MALPQAGLALASAADAAVLASLRRGERAAFAGVMRQHNRRLYRLARGILGDGREAEDAVQEGYIHAFTHLDGFRGEAGIGTWLARIVINEALARRRRRRPTVALEDVADSLAAASAKDSSDAASPENAAARREVGRLVERAIDGLAQPFRAVFMLRVVEQLSVEETAELLGIPPATVKTRLHRANLALRGSLGSELGTILDDAFPFAGARCDRMLDRVMQRLAAGRREIRA